MEGFLLIDFKIMLPRFILMWFSTRFKNLYTKSAHLNRESPSDGECSVVFCRLEENMYG